MSFETALSWTMKKSLFLTLILTFDFFVLNLAASTNDSLKREIDDDSAKILLKIISLGNGGNAGEEYFLGLTEKEIILFKKFKGHERSQKLEKINSRTFPAGFRIENVTFSSATDGSLLCSENSESTPECLLIVVSGKPYSQIEPFLPIDDDFRNGRSSTKLRNVFRVISDDGINLITAFLNETKSSTPSWIIRQEFDEKSALITTGTAFDHRLAKFRSEDDASRNVYAFRHGTFAYFLRYAFRYNHVENNRLEWVWQLTRVCTNDRTRELRSRASIPLNCSFTINSEEEKVTWKPTNGYFDEKDEKLYVYIQADLEYSREIQALRDIRHRICSFDMAVIAQEYERGFNRCYDQYSTKVAVHGGYPATYFCSEYKSWEGGTKCQPDMCSWSEACDVPKYHVETYTPVYGTPVSVIDFRYQSDKDLTASQESPPTDFYVTKTPHRGKVRTTQAFIRNSRGSLFMIFLNSTKPELNAPHAPAWTNSSLDASSSNTGYLLELPHRNGVQLVDGTGSVVSVYRTDCGLYPKCQWLMNMASGEQARRLWGCGWCVAGEKSFSTTLEHCGQANGVFHQDLCPAMAECFEPKSWLSDENVTLEIRGYFPTSFDYKVVACGSECRDLKRLGNEPEDKLTCVASPPYHLSGQRHGTCGVEISVASANGSNRLTLDYSCESRALITSGVKDAGEAGRTDKIIWWALAAGSFVIITILIFYALVRCHRRRAKKRQRNDDSLTLPMTVSLEMSAGNEYVQRRVHQGNRPVILSVGRQYEDLSPLVPSKLLMRLNSIELECLVGQGHFGQVYKGRHTPTGDQEPISVAIKTLQSQRNARQFLQEGILMETFDHPHVLSLIGITFGEDNMPMIVMPFMGQGDLLKYIRNPQNNPTMGQLLKFGVDIAAGMQYLHKLKFIHRDLAARNCMLDNNFCVKVSDFGLSRDVYESECYLSSQQTDLPIRWMPPESIEQSLYTLKSDVWSYGVVLWELTTRGKVPYADMSGPSVLHYLKSGRRLANPHCPEDVYDVMRSCWLLVPEDRPSFLVLCERLPAAIASSDTALLSSPQYYNVAPIGARQIVTTA